jgi:hypothetical protein
LGRTFLRVEVHFVGNQFVAYDEQGNQIKDRYILEQISFDQMPGFRNSYYIEVDKNQNPAIMNNIQININTDNT